MSQSTYIVGALLFAYFVYITVNGDLKKWLGLLGI